MMVICKDMKGSLLLTKNRIQQCQKTMWNKLYWHGLENLEYILRARISKD